jgi:hypothetical protein
VGLTTGPSGEQGPTGSPETFVGNTVYVPTSDFYVNGSPAPGTLQPIFWGSMLGGAIVGPISADPLPAGNLDWVVVSLGLASIGGLQYPWNWINIIGSFASLMPIYLPVPAGATGIAFASMETQVLAIGGGNTTLTLWYDPLNGGATSQASRAGIVAPDPGWVTLNLPGPLAAPTPGHFVKLEYRQLSLAAVPPVGVGYTKLVVGWL